MDHSRQRKRSFETARELQPLNGCIMDRSKNPETTLSFAKACGMIPELIISLTVCNTDDVPTDCLHAYAAYRRTLTYQGLFSCPT